MGLPIALVIIGLPLLLVAVRPAWKDVTEPSDAAMGCRSCNATCRQSKHSLRRRPLPRTGGAATGVVDRLACRTGRGADLSALLVNKLVYPVSRFGATNQSKRLHLLRQAKVSRSTSKSQKTEDEAAAEDPLALGYRKSSVALSVRGPMPVCRRFFGGWSLWTFWWKVVSLRSKRQQSRRMSRLAWFGIKNAVDVAIEFSRHGTGGPWQFDNSRQIQPPRLVGACSDRYHRPTVFCA